MRPEEITHWKPALALYRQTLAIPEDEREHYLSTLEISPEVHEKLQQLLRHAQSPGQDPLQTRLEGLVSQVFSGFPSGQQAADADKAMVGRDVGGWTILERIGRGGMASVFKAERRGVEFSQHGALKLLSLLHLATGGSTRFVREQQFLAQLRHPNIAMLLDGGVAEDGTPFLVTELVDGVDIQQWCKQNKPSPRNIVRLLQQVCSAVNHAHGRLILHRDIKPSNVMVNQEGQVKLLDFGIARLATATKADEQTRVFSPQFAAPEQKSGQPITTATDVHGVGMLARILLDDQLDTNPELALIVEMATRTNPDRRYTTIESMNRDLQAWLENHPIVAARGSAVYRLGKFVRRNRVLVSAAGAVLVTAVIGLAAVLWQAEQAHDEALKANTLARFMIGVFASGDLLSGSGPNTPISELMRDGARRARVELQNTPASQAEVLRVIGLAQTEFGEYEEAGSNLDAALESATTPLEQAKVLGALGVWAAEQSDFDQGIAWMQQALVILERELRANHPDRIETELNLINFLLFTGRQADSLERADRLLAETSALEPLSATDQANLLRSRGIALTQSDHFDEAIENLQQAIGLTRTMEPPRPALTAAFLNDLGNAYSYAGDQEAAIERYAESFRIQSNVYGESHKRTLTSGSNLVHAMRATGQTDRAIDLGFELLPISLTAHGPTHRSVVLVRFALALALSDAARDREAIEQISLDVEAIRQLPDLRSELPNHLAWQGEIQIRQGDFAAAINNLEEAEQIRNAEFPDEPRRYRVAAQQRLVQAHAASGNCDISERYWHNIAAEVSGGNPDLALATEIYRLNCQGDQAGRSQAFSALRASREVADVGAMNASLRAALRWGTQAYTPASG